MIYLKTIITTYILILIFFLSCKEKEVEDMNQSAISVENGISVIHLENSQKLGKIKLKDFFGSMRVVLLENNGLSEIANISKIIIEESSIIILDNYQKAVFVFELNGSFKYKIDRQGRGPGEYLDIWDIALNRESNQLILYDGSVSKFIFIDAIDGSFIHEKIPKLYGAAIAHIVGDKIAFFINNNSKDYKSEDGVYNLLTLDSTLQPVKVDYSIPDEQFHNSNKSWANFSQRTDSTLLFSYLSDYNIYEMSEDSLMLKFIIDPGERGTDYKALFNGKPMPDEISIRMSKIKTIRNIETFVETDKYILFHFRDTTLRNVLIDKISNKAIIYDGFINNFGDQIVYPRIISSNKNQIVLAGKSTSLRSIYNTFNDCCMYDVNPELVETEEKNPILFIGTVDLNQNY